MKFVNFHLIVKPIFNCQFCH